MNKEQSEDGPAEKVCLTLLIIAHSPRPYPLCSLFFAPLDGRRSRTATLFFVLCSLFSVHLDGINRLSFTFFTFSFFTFHLKKRRRTVGSISPYGEIPAFLYPERE
jgi:hypothetical protein